VYEYATDLVEDVCAHNHIVGQIDISINKNYSSIFFYECEVVYGVLFTYPLMDWNSHELDEDNIVYTSIFEFGMKNVYGDDPGWFMPIVRINIKNQGSEEENHALMESTMNRIRIQCQYYKWKDNSGS
jgi:hypothetical protein